MEKVAAYFKELVQYLFGRTQENHDNSQSVYPV
jgi:hypothetical protein